MDDGTPNVSRRTWPHEFYFFIGVAICIGIALLVAYLLPSVARSAQRARATKAKWEASGIVSAIHQYQTTYSRFPVSAGLATNNASDFTFGTFDTSAAAVGITNANGHQANNSEIMAILMDLTKLPNGNDTLNTNHFLNPQKIIFLTAKMTEDTNSPGVGLDGVFRDPWGNPYIITLDLNNDTKTRDAFYRLASVSEITPTSTSGLNRLFRSTPPPYSTPETRDAFEAQTSVMVWSLGPDGKADSTKKANEGVNADNVLSW